MTEKTPPKTKYQLAAEAARELELESVCFLNAVAQVLPNDGHPPSVPEGGYWFQPTYKASISRLGDNVDVALKLAIAARQGGQEGEERLRLNCELVLRYLGGKELEKAQLEAFADLNGLVNGYPYFREFVQNATVKMGLPPLILPLLKLTKSGPPPAANLAKPKLEKPEKKTRAAAHD